MQRNPILGSVTRLIAVTLLVMLSACGGGGGNAGSGGGPSSPPQILSADKTSALPMSALFLKTSHVDPGASVSATFSDGSGYSVTVPPAEIKSDGTVVVGVPLYLSSGYSLLSHGQVTVTLSNSAGGSNSVSLNIEDLPDASVYGTNPGDITRAFLIFAALEHGRRVNGLLAAQPLVSSANVDTSSAASSVNTMAKGAILARYDVDNIRANPTTTYHIGTMPDGTTLSFDLDELTMMDRVLGLYLAQQQAANSAAVVPTGMIEVTPSILNGLGTGDPRRDAVNSLSQWVQSAISAIQTHSGAAAFGEKMAGVADADSYPLCALGAIGPVLEKLEQYNLAGLVGIASGYAHMAAAMDSLYHNMTDAIACNGDPGCGNATVQNILDENQGVQAKIANADFEAVGSIGFFSDMQAALGSNTAGNLSQIANSIATYYIPLVPPKGYSSDTDYSQAGSADAVSALIAGPDLSATILGSSGEAAGGTHVTYSGISGEQVPLSGLNLCCFGASSLGITGIADPAGNYDIAVPLGVSGTTYNSLSLQLVDPILGSILGSETVNLSGLAAGNASTVPQDNGKCSDGDYNSGDGDDPDCD